MQIQKYIVIISLLYLLSGCSKPLPSDRFHYTGAWQGQGMSLSILADGTVSYQRSQGGKSTSINAPLKEFVGDDFVVGILFMTTTFVVSKPPHETNGVWRMTVDGVELTKISNPTNLTL